jgi:Zn-dependent metalloprotease
VHRRRRLISVLVGSALALGGLAVSPAAAQARRADGLRKVAVKQSLLATHTWFQQTYRGRPVLGGFLVRHVVRSTGAATVDDGRLAVRGPVAAQAKVPAAQARTKAGRAAHSASVGAASLAVLPGTQARLVWSVVSSTPRGSVRTLVDASTGAVLDTRSLVRFVNGSGRVFDPNPIVTLQNESLTDQNDADAAAFQPAYKTVTLANLDGSGYLHGTWATIALKARQQAFEPTQVFSYNRLDDRFEQVMAYYDVDVAQAYIQSIGFTDVNNEAQDLLPDAYKGDNSFYDPNKDTITLGIGGVDDAEDAEVTWHEYGHAMQDDQVPNFGSNLSAGSIGEGFGDYWAFTMTQANSPDTATTPLACIADWDSVSYTSGTPHCLRRVDTNLTMSNYDPNGDVHDNGQIWSRALRDVNLALGREKANTIILEGQFSFTPTTSFEAAAQRTIDAARALYNEKTAKTVKAQFAARGITGLT